MQLQIRLLHHLIAWSASDEDTSALDLCEQADLKPEHFFVPQPNGFALRPSAGALCFRIAYEHYRSTRKRIPLHELNQKLRNAGAPSDIYEEANALIAAANVTTSNGSDVENIIEEIKKTYSAASFRSILSEVVSREKDFIDDDPDAVRERLINALQETGAGTKDSKLVVPVNDPSVLQKRIDTYGERSEQAEQGLKTGFPTLDNAIHGLRPGELVLFAAQPKSGKSAAWLSIALNMVTEAEDAGVECDVLIANREMQQDRQIERMEAWFMQKFPFKRRLGSLTDRIHNGTLYEDELVAYALALEQMSKMKNKVWMVDPRAYETVDDIEGILVRYKQSKPIKALFVDSLNDQSLAKYGTFVAQQYQALEAISRRLDRMSTKHQIVVVAEVQEKAASEGERYISMADLFADSSGLGRPITHALRLFPVPEGDGLVELQMVASRFCQGGWGFPIEMDVGNMRIREADADVRAKVNALCEAHKKKGKR